MVNVKHSTVFPISGGSSSIAGLTSQGTKSSDFTASSSSLYEITASCKMTLPNSPSVNDKVGFVLTSTSNFDITSTEKFNGSFLAIDYAKRVTRLYVIIVLTYSGSTNGWVWDNRDNSYISDAYTGAGDPFSSFVSFYTRFEGSNGATTATDESVNNASLIFAETAAISTTQKKYGNSSLFLNNQGRVIAPLIIQNQCTLEGWFYNQESVSITRGLFAFSSNNSSLVSSNQTLSVSMGSTIIELALGGTWVTVNYTRPLNTWFHLALVRDGSTFRLYIDGVLINTATNSANFSSYPFLNIGSYYSISAWWKGFIDSFRVTNAVRYTSNFDPELDTFLWIN